MSPETQAGHGTTTQGTTAPGTVATLWSVLTCRSIHAALSAERALKGAGIEVELIPVPREIKSDCGVCLRLPFAGEAAASEPAHAPAPGIVALWRITYTPAPGGKTERRHEFVRDFD